MDMFERATRGKVRFTTTKGLLTIEDLFDLPLTSNTDKPNLDAIAKDLYLQVKNSSDIVSFVTPNTNSGVQDVLNLKFDIVKYVIDVKVKERDLASEATKRREEKQKILGIIADKQDEALKGKSLEDLLKMVDSL